MAFTSPNMGLRIWNLITDAFSHTDLFNNFAVLDAHNHTSGYGVPIPAGGLAPGSVTAAALAIGAVTPAAISFPAYVSLVANGSAAPGQCIVATGGITVSLPAANAASSTPINIVAGPTASGSSPVTVSATGGATILGLGLGNTATSFLLGTPGARATLVAGGGRWVMVDGAQDTGWVAVSLGSLWSATGAADYLPTARVTGDRVQCRGRISNSSTGAAPNAITVPAFARPAGNIGATLVEPTTNATITCEVISATGNLTLSDALPFTGNWSLDAISYSLS